MKATPMFRSFVLIHTRPAWSRPEKCLKISLRTLKNGRHGAKGCTFGAIHREAVKRFYPAALPVP